MTVCVTTSSGEVDEHDADDFHPDEHHHLFLVKDDGTTRSVVATYAAGCWTKAVAKVGER